MVTASDAELLARSLRNPGKLCLGPTTTSGAFPFGGVSMGSTTGIRTRFDVPHDRRYDPSNKALAEIGRGVENLALLGVMRDWDDNLQAAIFTKVTPAASLPVASPPETRIEGATTPALVPAQAAILFVSDDRNQRCVYLRRPVVTIDMSDPLVQWALARGAGLAIQIEPTQPLGKKPWQICRLENLALELA